MSKSRPGDVVTRAQIRLTLLFAGLVIVLVLVSTAFLYVSFSSDLQNAARHEFETEEDEEEYVARSLDSLRWRLVVVDAGIVVFVGAAGLFYARRTLRPVRDNIAAQKRFIANASHDLRTPLAILKTDFEVALRDPGLDAQARPLLESGLEEVDGMSVMVDDLLTLSRIDAHQEVLASESFDLAALAGQTVDRLRGLATAAGVEVVLRAGSTPVPAQGDLSHVRRALNNVLRNAIEHAPPGSVVDVLLRGAAGASQVVVVDRGPGIPADVLAHVFDRFYRADPSRSGTGGNSGLGLPIARWALRAMGGDIEVHSEVAAGTRVTLTLPTTRS